MYNNNNNLIIRVWQGLTVHEDSSDEFHVRFIQITASLCVTENGLGQFGKFLKARDEGQDPHFTLLRDLHLLHLSDLTKLKAKHAQM